MMVPLSTNNWDMMNWDGQRYLTYQPIEIRDETDDPHDGEPSIGRVNGGVSAVVFGGKSDGEKQRSEHASADCRSEGGIVGEDGPAPLQLPLPQFELGLGFGSGLEPNPKSKG